MNELDQALKTHLNVGTVTGLATGGVWNTQAPQGTAAPYVIYQQTSEVLSYQFGGTVANLLYMVQAISDAEGPALAGSIDTRVRDRLQHGTLAVTGWTLAGCQRESGIFFREGDSPAYWHAGAYYRILLDKS